MTRVAEGYVGSKEEIDKVQAILRAYGIEAENLIKIGGGKQILIEVEFIEMTKSGTKRFGISWPQMFGLSSISGQVQGEIPISPARPHRITANLMGKVDLGRVAIEALYSTGKARLLAQPKMVCGSGKTAEFLVGGQVPVVTTTQMAVQVKYKDYGIRLTVKPTADSLGNVSTNILAEVSDIDDSVSVMGVPGFRTRRFHTFVTVKEGSSIVLSGLFTTQNQKSTSKVPLLGHIPILGELFKSRDFRDRKTTLVVLVTPRLIATDDSWIRNQIRDIQQLYNNYANEVGWEIFD